MKKRLFAAACCVLFLAVLPAVLCADTPEEAYARGLAAEKQKDRDRAYREFLSAAERGHTAAQKEIGMMFLLSPYPEDFIEGKEWFAKVARKGDSDAQLTLAMLWRDGDLDGNFIDYGEAVKWYRTASRAKIREHRGEALRALAEMHEEGQGLPRSLTEAVRLYTLAAKEGDCPAMHRLGTLSEHGAGTPRDPAAAYFWYDLASREKGSLGKKALSDRKRIAPLLSEKDRARVRTMAKEWAAGAKK